MMISINDFSSAISISNAGIVTTLFTKQEIKKSINLIDNLKLDERYLNKVEQLLKIEYNKLLSIEEIKILPNPEFDLTNTSGIYFLFNEEELVYIGKSVEVFNRVYTHVKNERRFTTAKIMMLPANKIDDAESKYTLKYLSHNYKVCNSVSKAWIREILVIAMKEFDRDDVLVRKLK